MRATRRTVLLGAAAAATSACTGDAGGREARPAPVDPDVALRAEAVARERALLAAYDALLAAEPDRAALLVPLRAEHEAHLGALDAEPSTTPPPPSAAPGPGLPGLVQAERAAAAAHAAATVPASPALAAVLAQLAASEASHPVALA